MARNASTFVSFSNFISGSSHYQFIVHATISCACGFARIDFGNQYNRMSHVPTEQISDASVEFMCNLYD